MSITYVPDTHADLLTGPICAILTTVAPDGVPENTVIWCSWDGEHVLVTTAAGRRKTKNVQRNPKVALIALDPQDPFRWIDVRGVVEVVAPDPECAQVDAHAKLYAGVDHFFGGVVPAEQRGTEERVVIKIKPQRVLVFPD